MSERDDATAATAGGGIWMLWDGDCGFCARVTDWVQRRDARRGGHITAVPYQKAPSPPMTPELYAACARAIHVITPENRVLRAGRACLYIADVIGLHLLARVMSLPPLIWGVEIAYRIVAANRYFFSRVLFPRASAGAPACSVHDRTR